ncbi:MAG TPA: chloride channel protein [Allosphingosinicella sp.]|nr:chloride channel protein [Allosphingosinicella sp.]
MELAEVAERILRRISIVWRRSGRKRLHAPLAVLRRRAASVIGAVLLSLAAIVFAAAGDRAQHLFLRLAAASPYLPLVLTPAVFAAIVWLTRRFVPAASGSGIPQVIAASRVPAAPGAGRLVSIPTAAAKLAMTVAVLAVGGAAGREGPTVQTSAAVMVWVHRLFRVPITAGVVIAGGAAGVAAAFNTPLAGVAFAIEELASAYEQRVAILVMGAVMISGLASLGIAGDYVYFGALRESLSLRAVLIVAPVAGIGGGIAGGLFARLVLALAAPSGPFARRLRARPVAFAACCGLAIAIIGIVTHGATWGTGYAATRQLIENHGQPLWFGPAKFVAAAATTLSGAPGGIFAPSLSVGAGFGNLLTPLFPNDPAGAIVLLGMAAYFVGVVRAPLTAVIILSETTANRGMILPLFATALLADAASGLVCRERLYHGLSKPFARAIAPPRTADSAAPEAAHQ